MTDRGLTAVTKESWNAAVLAENGSFLQSWEWGELQQKFGRRVFRISAEYQILGQVIRHELPLGRSYLYCPRGPLFVKSQIPASPAGRPNPKSQTIPNVQISNDQNPILFGEFLKKVRECAVKEKSIFLRIDPPSGAYGIWLMAYGAKDAGRSLQPRENLIIDLTKNEDELLRTMHEKTRYNIRVAQRHGIVTQIANRPSTGSGLRLRGSDSRRSRVVSRDEAQTQTPELFCNLLQETAERQKIRLHPRRYYELMLQSIPRLSASNSSQLAQRVYFAVYQGKAIAAALVVYFGNRATYLHGGSSLEHKNVMAPYLLHWQIMADAKREGFAEYDLGGINEAKWEGLTRFKRGFGGRTESFPNAHDAAFDPFWYRLYRLSGKLLRRR